jgi:hypothetical protein
MEAVEPSPLIGSRKMRALKTSAALALAALLGGCVAYQPYGYQQGYAYPDAGYATPAYGYAAPGYGYAYGPSVGLGFSYYNYGGGYPYNGSYWNNGHWDHDNGHGSYWHGDDGHGGNWHGYGQNGGQYGGQNGGHNGNWGGPPPGPGRVPQPNASQPNARWADNGHQPAGNQRYGGPGQNYAYPSCRDCGG